MVDGPENLTDRRRRLNIRWLAVGAGLALVLPCFGITVFYLVMPVMLIVGGRHCGRVATHWQVVDVDWRLLAKRLGIPLVRCDTPPSRRPS